MDYYLRMTRQAVKVEVERGLIGVVALGSHAPIRTGFYSFPSRIRRDSRDDCELRCRSTKFRRKFDRGELLSPIHWPKVMVIAGRVGQISAIILQSLLSVVVEEPIEKLLVVGSIKPRLLVLL